MKLHFISFAIVIILFSACGRNSCLIKKRYSKGFYTHRPSKIKTEAITFSSYPYKTVVEQYSITPQKNELTVSCLKDPSYLSQQMKPKVKPLVIPTDHFNPITTKSTKQPNKISYKVNDGNSHLFSGITIVLALAMLVALTKIFGLLFTIAVCFIIAFTAISIFFIIRTHLN